MRYIARGVTLPGYFPLFCPSITGYRILPLPFLQFGGKPDNIHLITRRVLLVCRHGASDARV
jgi:hypothetical protein